MYVPTSAIVNLDHAVVYLNVTQREAEEIGWEQPPREGNSLYGPAFPMATGSSAGKPSDCMVLAT